MNEGLHLSGRNLRLVDLPQRVALLSGFLVILGGLLVLSGWMLNIPTLKSILAGWPEMAAATALGFVLSGVSLCCVVLAAKGKIHLLRVSQICAIVVALGGLLKLCDYFFGCNLQFDSLGFNDGANQPPFHPAQMAQFTALDFVLLGGALLLAEGSYFIGFFQALTLLAGLVGWLGLFRYVFGGEPLLFYGPMAIHTAIGFLVLSVGIFNARTDGGLMALLISDSAGGLLARRMLPSAVFLVLATNCFESWIGNLNWFSSGAQSSLFLLTDMILFCGLVWFAAAWLRRADLRRKQAEQTGVKLAAIVDSSDDAIISKTLEGIITSWNHGAEKIFGYSADEAVGKPMLMFFPPERLDEERDILARIARGETVEHFETVRVTKDGKRIDVSAAISPVRDEHGKIIGASKIARDITARKQAEKSLKLFRALIDQSTDGIEVVDAQTGRFLDINETTCAKHGYTRDEMLALSVAQVDTSINTSSSWPERAEKIRNVKFLVVEGIHRRKDGSEFPVEVNVRYVKADRDYMISVVRDITERKRTEEIQARLAAIVREMNEACFMLDKEWRFTFVNDRCEILLRHRRKEMLGQSIWELFHQLVGTPIEKNYRRAMAERTLVSFEVFSPVAERWLDVRLFPSGDGLAAFLLDIQARKKAEEAARKSEEQLRQAQKMEAIGQLAGGVAHDFNNILAVIQMQADLLKIGENPAEHKEFADEIGAAAQRAAALTRQLLLFSRKETVHPHDLDLNESINNMTKMLRRILGENIQTQFKFAMQKLFVHADAGMLDQVLMNLAVNSRDAMPDGGKLIIETAAVEFDDSMTSQSANMRSGSFVCLSVSDTGCGIPQENLQRIFEPFFTTKGVNKGTGLGLATVFGIVQQHEGWINVYSEVGHGTTFRIYLPRLQKMSGKKSAPPALNAIPGGHETILLVEDDAFLRASVRKSLAKLGYRVFEAVNGIEALEIWEQHRDEIHLMLTDLVMPGGITGIDLGAQLLKENPKLKIIYASGYSAEVMGKDFSLEEGVNFLTKPFQAQKLAQSIRANLDPL